MLCAVPGSGGATLTVVPDEPDEELAAARCEAMTWAGFTSAGAAATVRVLEAASMTMMFLRSWTINATEPLRGSALRACARLLAPLPLLLVILAPTATATTSMTATKNAGSTMPRRRLRRELRAPVETGLASVAARFRDNAVPSVCVQLM